MGSGLGALAVRLAARDAPPTAATVIAAAGSFAAISSLLGSPLLGAFLLLEAAGLGGPMLGLVLVPGLLAAGIGTLVFLGLDSLTGFGTFSLAIPGLPPFDQPTGAMFLWAIVFGLVAPFLGRAIRGWRPPSAPRRAADADVDARRRAGDRGLAIAFARSPTRRRRGPLLRAGPLPGRSSTGAAGRSAPCCCCWSARRSPTALSLARFRGGPVFPAMFLGAAPASRPPHLPGLDARARGRHGDRRDVRGDADPAADPTLLATLLLGSRRPEGRCRS